MNEAIISSCNCNGCKGAGCQCGCQTTAANASCGCSSQCGCGSNCKCANCAKASN